MLFTACIAEPSMCVIVFMSQGDALAHLSNAQLRTPCAMTPFLELSPLCCDLVLSSPSLDREVFRNPYFLSVLIVFALSRCAVATYPHYVIRTTTLPNTLFQQ